MNLLRSLVAAISALLFGSSIGHATSAVDTTAYVYVPIAPCRIVDTRVTGGPFAAKETRVLSTNGAATQGGSACTVYPGTIPSALSLNVTVDATSLGSPNQVGFLSILPVANTTGTSWMNFAGGEIIANAGVATINSDDGSFAIKTQFPANVVVDVYGYWEPSPVQFGAGASSDATGFGSTATGSSSDAIGYQSSASGDFSVAVGSQSDASGQESTALGALAKATGLDSTAIGADALASGVASIVLGNSSTASGFYATALGNSNTASGEESTAMGISGSTNGYAHSFVYGDASALTSNDAASQFMVRASGGFKFFTSDGSMGETGVSLANGSGSWTALSDRNAKDAVLPINGTEVLDRVLAMPLATWHYKAQDPQYRHMGPMAQDFYSAFHLGESDTGIDTIDADGVALAAIQGLNSKIEQKDKRIAALETELNTLAENFAEMKSELAALKHAQTSDDSLSASAPK